MVGDLFRVERDDVREIPPRDPAAPVETKVPRRKAREPADGLLERHEAFVAHVVAEQSREGAVRAWVRVRFEEHTLWSGSRLV